MRYILTFLIGGLLGAGVGFAAGIYIFPFWFPPAPANEQLVLPTPTAPAEANDGTAATTEVAAAPTPLSAGTFIHANPNDRIHWGRGSVDVYETAVFLNDDFEVGPGPDYHVYLVEASEIRTNRDVDTSSFVDLGRLRAFEGSQQYNIPDGVDVRDYNSVVIWCQQFGVLISPADIAF